MIPTYQWCLAALVLTTLAKGPGLISRATVPTPAAPVTNLRLKMSSSRRYLVDQKDTPFLVVGDSPWSLIAQLDEQDIEWYLKDRRSKGFNSIIVNLIEHKFCTNPPRTRAGLAPFIKPGDFSTPNEAYFDFAHKVIEKAGEFGMVVWLAPAYLGYGGGDEGFFREIRAGGRDKLGTYGRFVGKQFKDLPNIVWMLGGDYTPGKPDQWTVNELAEAIREEDPTHLMTAHHSPESSAVGAFGEQKWLDVSNFYGYEKSLFRPMLAESRRQPVRPFVLLEATYEGEHDSTPDEIRRQAYWAMLSGACGQFFGNNPIWHFDGPGLFPAKMSWRQALNNAGSRDMALLRSLFASLPWYRLVPEDTHAVVAEGYGDGTAAVLTARTENGRLSLSYVPSAGSASRTLSVVLSGFAAPVRARWYNPVNGNTFEVTGSPFENRDTRRFLVPGDNGSGADDWVLILDTR
jgi:hypothetical protein